ncbi:hypothetical protein KJA13_00350 [Patescibacteria group bacterium]|nr:hypothetical protein [Patescibacteria group bacterium]
MKVGTKVEMKVKMILMPGIFFLMLAVALIYITFSGEASDPSKTAIAGIVAAVPGITFTSIGLLWIKEAVKKGIKKAT